VRWYWIVDPDLRSLEVFELDEGGRYVRALGVSSGTVRPPGCESDLDLTALWAETDRLGPEEPEPS
jgi:hypothetical protein